MRNVLNVAGDGKGTIAISGFRNASVGPISGILTLGISSDDKLFLMLDAGLGKVMDLLITLLEIFQCQLL
ncbi:MAG: hypothetical protein Q9M92_18190 [Enterobacterales bacterium]|nr:hypothetical protein [Enterobacterales bacterium]